MGYYSSVTLKTTTEGYLMFKKYNDSIEDEDTRPLNGMIIERTASGFYRISCDWTKWYEDSFPRVTNFMNMLDKLEDMEIPYKFIRIGEELTDIETLEYYDGDTPDEIRMPLFSCEHR